MDRPQDRSARIASIMSPPTRSTVRWARTIRRFTRSSSYAPNSPYSASKAGSDHLVRAYHETYGLDTTVTNCSNNYGPYQFPEKLIPLTIVNILLGKPLPVYGDGLQMRDWLHVSDHCAAISLALTRRRARRGLQYRRQQRNRQYRIWCARCARLVDELSRANAPNCERTFPASPAVNGERAVELITHVRDRPGTRPALCHRLPQGGARARLRTGYRSRAADCEATLDWYLANRDWWRALLKRRLRGLAQEELRRHDGRSGYTHGVFSSEPTRG